jgi:hypothetical protein
MGCNNFAPFKKLIRKREFRAFFPKDPFGGYGLSRKQVVDALRAAIDVFQLPASVKVEHLPTAAADIALGLASVREGKRPTDSVIGWSWSARNTSQAQT